MGSVAPGEVLAGRFELVRRIGAGGLAEVYAAHDRVSRGEVAIKILHAHLAEDRDLAERFRREMAVTRALDHPGIVRVFDLHEHDGRPFFSMELLQGKTLYEAMLQEGRLKPEDARRIAREICAALQAAHRAGVVHRDLKPQNVFVTQSRAIKLLDFGLARVAGQTRLTSKTAILGTPGYIAPELFAGQRPDARADLYALGATYFEMLTGKRPFASSDPYGVPAMQREPIAVDGLAETDAAILRRALDPDPEQRFLDASQMLRALTGESVPRPPATPPPMSAGEYDVLVHNVVRPVELLQKRPPIVKVLDRLGAQAGPQWRFRLLGAGQAVLVSGASRRTAEAAAAVCAEHGLPATVRPVSLRPWSEEWMARHGGWVLALLCAGGAGLIALVMDDSQWWIAAGAMAGYLLSWGLRPPPSKAPLVGLPGQDSTMARLADGIARRAERLRKGKQDLPAAHQAAVDELVRAANDATGLARQATAEAPPDSGPALHAMDLLTSRLLQIATALDDALAQEGADSVVLRRLKEDADAAQKALKK
jgi:hypothetical protein